MRFPCQSSETVEMGVHSFALVVELDVRIRIDVLLADVAEHDVLLLDSD